MSLFITATKLRRLSRPAIFEQHLRDLGRFDELVHARPPSLMGLEVAVKEPRATTAEDVMDELARLRRRYASVVDCGTRAAERGDSVVVDIASHVDGEPDPKTRRTNVAIPLDPDFSLPDLSRALEGAKAGSVYVVSVDFADDFDVICARGFRVTYTIKVRQVVRRELPSTEDETFLRALGVDDADESLAEALWTRVTGRRRAEEKRDTTSAVLAQLTRCARPVEVPRDLLEAQVRRHWMLVERPALGRWCFARSHIDAAFMRWMATTDEAEHIEADLHVGYLLDALARVSEEPLSDDDVAEVLARVHSGVDTSEGGAIIANGRDEARHIARLALAAEQVMGYARVTHVDPLADTLERTNPGRRLPPTSMESLG